MNSCAHYQELISRLVDDDVSREEYDELLAHMNTCSRCSAIYAVFYDLDKIIAAEEAEELPEGLHENIMAGVRRSEIEKKNRRARTVWKRTALTAAACAALVLFAVRGLSLTDRTEGTVVRSVEVTEEQAVSDALVPETAAPAPIPQESEAPEAAQQTPETETLIPETPTPETPAPTPESSVETPAPAPGPAVETPASTPEPAVETPAPTPETPAPTPEPVTVTPAPAPAAAAEPTPSAEPEVTAKPTPAPIESEAPAISEAETVEEPVATASIQLAQSESADSAEIVFSAAEAGEADAQALSESGDEGPMPAEKRTELPRVSIPQALDSLTAPETVESPALSASPAPAKSESIRIAKEENRQKLQLLLSGKEAPLPEQLPDKSYELTLVSGDAYGSEEKLSIRVFGTEVYYQSTVGGSSKSFLAKCSPAELETLLNAVRADERAPVSPSPSAAPAPTPVPTVTPDPYLGTPDPAAIEAK